MTLEHSDFQGLFEKLAEITKKYQDNPEAIRAISQELDDLYKKIPIYPGIIEMSLPETVSPTETEELEDGNSIIITLKDGTKLSGKFNESDSEGLTLSDCKKFGPVKELKKTSVSKEDIEKIEEIKRNLLAKNWPSLDFEVEE